MSVAVPAPFHSSAVEVARLRGETTGAVITPDEADYDRARASWNRAFDARPAIVVEPADAADVAAAVRFARSAGLGVAVQATGHGIARTADGALLIATRGLTEVTVDPATRTARFGAGVTWAPVLAAAQQHGLAPLAGSSPHVGAVGYTLGGGMGWLARRHGLSSDKVRAVELVTADGEIRRVTAADDPDLFWALCGGGAGAFGVVTAMEIELVPVADVYAGNLLYPVELAGEIFARFADWVADVPDELTSAVAVMNYPPLDVVPEPVRGRSFAIVRGCWCGPVEQGARLLSDWRQWREPELDLFGPMPFADMAAISQDPVDPLPAVATSDSLPRLDAEITEVLLRHTLPVGGPPPLIFTEVRHGGGVLAADGGGAGRRTLGQVPFLTHAAGIVDPAAPERAVANAASMHEELGPYRVRHAYLNFLEGRDRLERAAEAFTPDELARLQRVKAAVDPDGRFGYGLPL